MERFNGGNLDNFQMIDKLLTDNPLHIMRLRCVYEVSEKIIRELNWQDISAFSEPEILLCGTGSPTTTLEYVNHVRKYNSSAQITVLDLCASRLDRSRGKLSQVSSINYTQGNALRLPFASNSFDRIETDRLLQFFPADEKKILLAEWRRILKTDGVITTREHLVNLDNPGEKVLDDTFKKILGKLGFQTYPITTIELAKIFSELGYNYSFQPFLISGKFGIQMPLNTHIVARKHTNLPLF